MLRGRLIQNGTAAADKDLSGHSCSELDAESWDETNEGGGGCAWSNSSVASDKKIQRRPSVTSSTPMISIERLQICIGFNFDLFVACASTLRLICPSIVPPPTNSGEGNLTVMSRRGWRRLPFSITSNGADVLMKVRDDECLSSSVVVASLLEAALTGESALPLGGTIWPACAGPGSFHDGKSERLTF